MGNLEHMLMELNKITSTGNFDQLELLKKVLPELEKYKDTLQQEQVAHLMSFAPRGRKAIDF